MAELKTFDTTRGILTVGGIPISGFSEDSKIVAERTNDTFTLVVGEDGHPSRSKSNDKSGNIKISLLQTSLSNDVLNGFAALDEQINGGVVPVMYKELDGTTLLVGAQCWIRKLPTLERGKGLKAQEWIFDSGELDYAVGGIAN